MLREDTVFGPIFSRRLGSSLGINLLPREGKICSFDCIYCECGWNRDGLADKRIPSADEVRSALEAKLSGLAERHTKIDSITFSGDGEPTLNPEVIPAPGSRYSPTPRECIYPRYSGRSGRWTIR